ncbi:23S rRNA (cytidine1920-2'-O)/16S rRNA (cytidine1409-2'-O)-methyltransferase [Inhella inkyongensis]|uniref:23S rRNA (Cytidine1920-2'-O)/16S rRNA (Cytidine1409-2'-O)-methyltransferase n=2 Tax=Inhella inkyongensis TaxID=392593 RepID=A0A840S3K3_9BURK|nr:TlyA family RNA methyltransferase [Inhella inkyongensis]MBB5203140.1 23S rRNA (cytidine1920-2'-O)/16S rRNA (cytidine1409-2'-O)-methyltransferase [Inhella inkyongensis]
MKLTERIDVLLVQRGLAPSRSAAQRLIAAGAVRWLGPQGWAAPKKAGDELPLKCELKVEDDAETRWVSRGGLKLEGAFAHCGLQPSGVALDLGQSTGGFSEVLLARGAERVVGVEVGHTQLHPRLRGDARIATLEGLNARELCAADLGEHFPAEGFDWVVGDLSFISLTLVLPQLTALLKPGARALLLVKPQFELQPADIGKGGLVKNEASYPKVETKLREAATAAGLHVDDYFASPIAGGDGNREFFLLATRT